MKHLQKLGQIALVAVMTVMLSACEEKSYTPAAEPTTNTPRIADAPIASVVPEKTVDLASRPAELLNRLEKAYNDRDLYAMLECYDPTISKAFFGVAQ